MEGGLPKESIEALRRIPENTECVDCGAPTPQWASVNLGILICVSCAGIHRDLSGTFCSRVKSLVLDKWNPDEIRNLENVGNSKAKEIWEASLPPFWVRPTQNDAPQLRRQWIRAKYELREFVLNDKDAKNDNQTTLPKPIRPRIPMLQSYLFKKGHVVKNWKKRWFVLKGTIITYHKKTEDYNKKTKPLGIVRLNDLDTTAISCDNVDGKLNCFVIKSAPRDQFNDESSPGDSSNEFIISAESERLMYEWVQTIKSVKKCLCPGFDSISLFDSTMGARSKDITRKPRNNVIFDEKKVIDILQNGLEFDTKREGKVLWENVFLGCTAVDTLVLELSLTSREHGVIIGQKLMTNKFLVSITTGVASFQDDVVLYSLDLKRCVQT